MMDLDKWQQREAEVYAADNGVTVDAAVKVLFPPAEAEVAAGDAPEGGGPVDPGAVPVDLGK